VKLEKEIKLKPEAAMPGSERYKFIWLFVWL